ncbi:MAG: alginate lyase family protein [Nitrospinae bacterium]|nr:alginate lyase family protein [Nitrospinota bacterium]
MSKKILRVINTRYKERFQKIKVKAFGSDISDEIFLSAISPLKSFSDCHDEFKSTSDFLRSFKERETPKFYLSEKEETISVIKKYFSDSIEKTVHSADKVLHHIFNILGSGDMYLGEKIDWHRDFKAGIRWNSKKYYKNIPLSKGDGSDIKVPWELSRFHHLTPLGKAYWFTSEERYAKEFIDEINDWIDNNPVYFGVNWACTMDVAIRITNWIVGYYFFKDSENISDEFLLKFLKSILAHGKFIRDNLEWSEELTSNHYLSNITGLVYLGILFPEFKEASEWREFGVRELMSEMDKQVYEDGVDFESSISYHRLALEFFLYPAILCKLNNIDLSEQFWEKLKRMFEFVRYYLKPNGLAPQIGDNDNGRLHIFKERDVLDHSYLHTMQSLLFNSPIDRFDEEVLWINPSAFNLQPSASKIKSKSFKEAGIYIMRDGNAYMIISCGPNGQKGNGGHCHNDKLGFELNIHGEDMIIDTGTFVYTSAPDWRNRFRSTMYHNTVMIDGKEQNRFKISRPIHWIGAPPYLLKGGWRGLFTLKDDSKARCLKWETTPEYDLFIGEHYGYKRLKGPVIHRREIYFDKREKRWQIKDRLEGEGEHLIECFYHFPPSVNVKQVSNLEFLISGNKVCINLRLNPNFNSELQTLNSELRSGWVSPSYGIKVPSFFAVYSLTARLPVELKFDICLKIHQ